MNINGKHHHTIWLSQTNVKIVEVIDQRVLPHKIEVFSIKTTDDAAYAIKEMVVRGAPLIGVTAAYGMYLACIEAKEKSDAVKYLNEVALKLNSTRPTAVNLAWAISEMLEVIFKVNDADERIKIALKRANEIKQEDIDI